ncbi:MAG: cell division protein SepF [Peptostreptococcaceae bacterium]|nr:cell division protein SepF [Peptostreptococcaceae bacterium]
MSVIDKIKFFMGIDDIEDDEVDEMEEDEIFSEQSIEQPDTKIRGNKILNIHTNQQMRVIVHEPKDFEEVPGIVDNLKNNKPVVINLEELEYELAKKIFDFLNGAVYALEGKIQKISKGIFIIAPKNVEIQGDFKRETDEKGIFPWQK